MKKTTMIAALIALCAIGASAADVYSANVVGYTKLTLQPGYNLIGAQFTEVGAAFMDVQSIDGGQLPGFNWDTEDVSTTMRQWTGTGYATFAWFGATDGTDALEDPDLDSKWVVESWDAAAPALFSPGEGLWIQLPATATPTEVTLSGEVVGDDTYGVAVNPGYNLICNPFPVEISIQNISGANLPGFNWNSEDVDTTLRKWTGTGYATYAWFGATDGTDALENPDLDSTWVIESWEEASTATFGVGEAFWVQIPMNATATTIEFTSPLSNQE